MVTIDATWTALVVVTYYAWLLVERRRVAGPITTIELADALVWILVALSLGAITTAHAEHGLLAYTSRYGLTKTLFVYVPALLLIYLTVILRRQLLTERLWLRRIPLGRALAWVVAAVTLRMLSLVVMVGVCWYFSLIPAGGNADEMVGMSFVARLNVMLYKCTLGPLLEELIFRGVIYLALRKLFGISVAVFLSAAAFAVWHQSLHSMCGAFVIGLILAYSMEKTQTLYVPIAIHCINNALVRVIVSLTA